MALNCRYIPNFTAYCTECDCMNRVEVCQEEQAQTHRQDTNLKEETSKWKIVQFLFIWISFFSVVWETNNVFSLSISSFDILSWWRRPLFSHRCLDWVMFKSMLIFSFAWLHCEETLSTLGNRTQGEQSGRVLHIPPQPTHLSPSSLLPHQTFVIEPEISGWAALMPGAY